jgi:hypothetical protein
MRGDHHRKCILMSFSFGSLVPENILLSVTYRSSCTLSSFCHSVCSRNRYDLSISVSSQWEIANHFTNVVGCENLEGHYPMLCPSDLAEFNMIYSIPRIDLRLWSGFHPRSDTEGDADARSDASGTRRCGTWSRPFADPGAAWRPFGAQRSISAFRFITKSTAIRVSRICDKSADHILTQSWLLTELINLYVLHFCRFWRCHETLQAFERHFIVFDTLDQPGEGECHCLCVGPES